MPKDIITGPFNIAEQNSTPKILIVSVMGNDSLVGEIWVALHELLTRKKGTGSFDFELSEPHPIQNVSDPPSVP